MATNAIVLQLAMNEPISIPHALILKRHTKQWGDAALYETLGRLNTGARLVSKPVDCGLRISWMSETMGVSYVVMVFFSSFN